MSLIVDYQEFIKNYNDNTSSLEAQRDVALLYATYLDQKDNAIELLNNLISNPRASLNLRSKSKLDLGDIYLLKEEPWESTLLYSQVEKSLNENTLGYEAKLKNAKLSFYKGDFRLAQEHLDILKEATTREIANDAMDLSMLIKENIAFDSVGQALKVYAEIELLLYQNKMNAALDKIEQLKQGYIEEVVLDTVIIKSTTEAFEFNAQVGDTIYIKAPTSRVERRTFTNHTILDDVYWLESKIRMQRGEFEKSISLLQQILEEYSEDVLADDAYFMQGEIYERQLGNKDKAMEIYREFLNRFPGSVYAAEARKRFRTLRGDFSNPEGVQNLN
jgi:tetratricopeptide (TPR) repeat protein